MYSYLNFSVNCNKFKMISTKQGSICFIVIFSLTIMYKFDIKHNRFFNKYKYKYVVKREIMPIVSTKSISLPRICVLVPVCSKGLQWNSINETFFVNMFLHSLYKTAEFKNHSYEIFMGYDVGDAFFDSDKTIEAIKSYIHDINELHSVNVKFQPVAVDNPQKKPGPVMNNISVTAWKDGCDYLYRINDDTELITPWATEFINALNRFSPPRYGVVGPTCHEGNTGILTHDFVHKTHIDVFGYHYPQELTDWWLDDWITLVYGPKNTLKLDHVVVKHHFIITRYDVNHKNSDLLKNLVDNGNIKFKNLVQPRKIVSYSLYGNDPRYLDGAVENSKLIKTVYPGWTMRVYYDQSLPSSMIEFLRNQEVELIDMTRSEIKNEMSWRFLPAAEIDLERFISRDIDSRLSQRELLAVQEWIDSGKPFHVLKDHPSHSGYSISGGMWGAVGGSLPEIKKWIVGDALSQDYMYDMIFLDKHVWPEMQRAGVMMHDSFSCDQEKTKDFPSKRNGTEHVGSVYLNGEVRAGDVAILANALAQGMPKC